MFIAGKGTFKLGTDSATSIKKVLYLIQYFYVGSMNYRLQRGI